MFVRALKIVVSDELTKVAVRDILEQQNVEKVLALLPREDSSVPLVSGIAQLRQTDVPVIDDYRFPAS